MRSLVTTQEEMRLQTEPETARPQTTRAPEPPHGQPAPHTVILPTDVKGYPAAIAQALSQLRVAGVDGPYSVLLSADAYIEVSETSDHGYPIIEHIKRQLSGDIIWAPAISGAVVLTTRGGDFSLHLGQDLAIGYLSHTDTEVSLYLQETLTFMMLTSEAAVGCSAPS